MEQPVVINIKNEKYDIYIGRPSLLGNPYGISKSMSRECVIEKFEKYAYQKIKVDTEFRETVKNLKGRLGCYCKPLACHGDVLVKLWRELNNVQENKTV